MVDNGGHMADKVWGQTKCGDATQGGHRQSLETRGHKADTLRTHRKQAPGMRPGHIAASLFSKRVPHTKLFGESCGERTEDVAGENNCKNVGANEDKCEIMRETKIRAHRSVGAGRARGASRQLITRKNFGKKNVISLALLGFFWMSRKRLRLQGHWRERLEGGFWMDFWLRFVFTAIQVSVLEDFGF